MDISKLVKTFAIGIVVILLAIYLGTGAATAQGATVKKVVVAASMLLVLALGKRIWLILPFTEQTVVYLIRGLTLFEVAQMVFIGMCFLLICMRKLPVSWSLGPLDKWMLVLLLCVVQAYARHPAGLNMLGTEVVGARPYFLIILAIVCCYLLGNFRIDAKELKWAMWLNLAGVFMAMPFNKLRWGSFSGGGATKDYSTMGNYDYGGGTSRSGPYSAVGTGIAKFVATFRSPVTACLHPVFGILVLSSLALAALSGYRNAIGQVGLLYIVAILYHGGFRHLLIAIMGFVIVLTSLSLVNLIHPLPGNIQRTMTIFPGTWEERYKRDARVSTEWRVVMWEKALFTDKFIKNKIIGDGISLTRVQLREIAYDGDDGTVERDGLSGQQRSMILTGSFHSGPVETIRVIGYVGFIVMLMVMTRVAVEAHRQIRRCQGTEFAPVAYFFGIPMIVLPFFWTFVFGTFSGAMVSLLFGSAMLKLIARNVPLPAYVPRSRRVYQPLLTRQPRAVTARIQG